MAVRYAMNTAAAEINSKEPGCRKASYGSAAALGPERNQQESEQQGPKGSYWYTVDFSVATGIHHIAASVAAARRQFTSPMGDCQVSIRKAQSGQQRKRPFSAVILITV